MNFSLNQGLLTFLQSRVSEGTYMALFVLFAVVTIAVSYLLGSINSAILVSKLRYHDDIRKYGSHNAGLTNTLRTYGKGAAGLTLLGDMLKTVVAIAFAGVLFGFGYVGGISVANDGLLYVAGLFAVLGHIFPVYYGFKGGKGVLVTATMALTLSPIPFLLVLLVFVGIVWTTKYVSLGSVTGALLYPVILFGYMAVVFPGAQMPGLMALSSILLAVVVFVCHRKNLQRIYDRTENKFSWGKKEHHD